MYIKYSNGVPMKNIHDGEAFSFEGQVYIKEKVQKGDDLPDALNVADGTVVSFTNETNVVPHPNAYLSLERPVLDVDLTAKVICNSLWECYEEKCKAKGTQDELVCIAQYGVYVTLVGQLFETTDDAADFVQAHLTDKDEFAVAEIIADIC